MKHSKHCNLCDNEIATFEKGIICGISKKKPEFEKYCSDIKLNKKFNERLENVNFKLLELKRKKKWNYLSFFLLIGFSFLLIFKSGTIAELNKNETYFLVHKVGIIAVGITILMNTIRNLTKYKEKLKSVKLEKNEINSVSKIYGIN
ncbi:hypothetical protein [Tenacibaculum bernardetii]|uniref:hypothetical protein n=1 Tax=Tenacibaculum bernardetii TaxID=3021375 RepID=UPI0023AF86BC|nr:hypothetical protein [Tenacibaculum bernardetii]